MQTELTIVEIDALIAYHRGVYEDAENNIAKWMKISHESATRIGGLSGLKANLELSESVDEMLKGVFEFSYSSQWTLVKKTEFVLRNITKKISTTREIAAAIKSREETVPTPVDNSTTWSAEPPIMHLVDMGDLISKLGATLKQKVDKGDTFARIEIQDVLYYGLAEWFEGKGKVKNEYKR